MPTPKLFKGWTPKHSPTQAADLVSSFALDVRAMHYAVNDTVVETRGQFKDERPGDVLRMLRGARFIR